MRLVVTIFAAACFVGCVAEPIDDNSVLSGQDLFANHCSACHGVLGEGDGPVAAVMQVDVPNLRTLAERNDGEFAADSIRRFVDGRELPVSHGDRYMPIWGNVFSWPEASSQEIEEETQRRIAAVVEFVGELQYAP